MKRKNKLIVFFILLIITTLLSSGSVMAETFRRKGTETMAFDLQSGGTYNYFCIQYKRSYTWWTSSKYTAGGIPSSVLSNYYNGVGKEYNDLAYYHSTQSTSNEELPPSLGYGLWYLTKTGQLGDAYGSQDSEAHLALQQLIWNLHAQYGEDDFFPSGYGSEDFPPSASTMGYELIEKADAYAQCYYEIFENLNGGSLFEAISDENELAVNVDQTAKTIVVGPYYLNLNVAASESAKTTLYNQIIREGVDDNTAFATYLGIENMNAADEPIFINKNGKEIKFPNFVTNEPFYIKFTPKDEGFITDVADKLNTEYKGKPVISVEYVNGFNGNKTVYEDFNSRFEDFMVSPRGADVTIIDGQPQGEPRLTGVDENHSYYELGFKIKVRVSFRGTYKDGTSNGEYVTLDKDIWIPTVIKYEWQGKSKRVEDYEDVNDDGYEEHVGYHYEADDDVIPTWFSEYKNRCLESEKLNKNYNVGEVGLPNPKGTLQDLVTVELNASGEVQGKGEYIFLRNDNGASVVEDRTYAENKEINMVIQGTVWKDMPSDTKQYAIDGVNDRVGTNGVQQTTAGIDILFPGVQVDLYELETKDSTSAKLIATTTTDANGKYYFYGKRNATQPLMNPLRKYFVVFTYNGELYQATYYKNELSAGSNDGYSNAKESYDDETDNVTGINGKITREQFNVRFTTIDPSGNNYSSPSKGGANSAYAYTAEIKDENGNLTGKQFRDVWAEFIKASTFKGSAVQDPVKEDYDKIWDRQQTYEEAYSSLDTLDSVKTFIKDCMITAKSYQMGDDDTSLYPIYDQFQIESVDKTSKKFQGIETRINWSAVPASAWTYTTKTVQKPVYENQIIGGVEGAIATARDEASKSGSGATTGQFLAGAATTSVKVGTTTVTYTVKTWNGSAGKVSDYAVNYPKDYDVIGITYHYLYTVKSAQCYYANFGMTWREEPEMSIQKDVYKARVIVNGKEHTYMYNSSASDDADDNVWTTELKAADVLYNSKLGYSYIRDVYKSDYIYTSTEDAIKNMQIIVTYRITLKNTGNVKMRVNELVDYYDYDGYQFDTELGTSADSTGQLPARWYNQYSYSDGDGTTATGKEPSSYIGSDKKGGILSTDGLKVYGSSQTSKDSGYSNNYETYTTDGLKGGNFNYHTIYLTGIVNTNGSEWFDPGEKGFVYLTFRVKTDANGKIKLDQNTSDGTYSSYPGKRNIIEINSYSTKYVDAATVPYKYNGINKKVGGKDAGLIDKSSNPGNLAASDLTSEGYLDYTVTEKKKEYTDEFRRRQLC